MTDFKQFDRDSRIAFDQAAATIGTLQAGMTDILRFENEALAAADKLLDNARQPSTREKWMDLRHCAEALRLGLSDYIGTVLDHVRLSETLRIGEYVDAMVQILASPEQSWPEEVIRDLVAEAKDAAWFLPTFRYGTAVAVSDLLAFAHQHLQAHVALFGQPLPGDWPQTLGWIGRKMTEKPLELLLPVSLPPLAQRYLDTVQESQRPHLAFSSQTTSDFDRINEFLAYAQQLNDTRRVNLEKLALATEMQRKSADQLKKLAANIYMTFRTPLGRSAGAGAGWGGFSPNAQRSLLDAPGRNPLHADSRERKADSDLSSSGPGRGTHLAPF